MIGEGLVDAHVHTVRSDGLLSLLQLASLARRSGLAAFVVTDHDVLADEGQLNDAGRRAGIHLAGGVELSTHLNGRGLHLLGYAFDDGNCNLRAVCERLQEGRRARWTEMTNTLQKQGVHFDERKMNELASVPAPGRMHLARELVRLRKAPNLRTAFVRFLQRFDNRMGGEPMPIQDAIAALHGAGGSAVLAHPPSDLTQPQWRSLIDFGLDGVEVDFPSVAKNHQRFLRARVAEYGLLATAGSDYHGDDPQRYLGCRTMTQAEWTRLLANPAGRDRFPVPATR